MNAPFGAPPDVSAPSDLPADLANPKEVFAARCEARALLHISGELSLHDAIDELQTYAEASGLLDRIGQDEVQRIMGIAFTAVDLLPDPDQDELEAACEHEIMLRAADMLRQWELADPRDSWRHTGEAPPPAAVRNSDVGGNPERAPRPYCPAASTVAAFRLVAAAGDVQRLKAWLADRPKDAPLLLALLESPTSC